MYGNQIYSNFTEAFRNTGLPGHVDLPRLRAGQNGGAFWSVYAPCPENGSDWSDETYKDSMFSLHVDQIFPELTRL
jgi:membrane dipeptidase